ncbi:unnamed protein product [Rangifer tarandus platyrhynchus]
MGSERLSDSGRFAQLVGEGSVLHAIPRDSADHLNRTSQRGQAPRQAGLRSEQDGWSRSQGSRSGRGSPAGLSASPQPGSQRRGWPHCQGPWWATLRALPPLCQNQQECQAPFAPLPPKAPKTTDLGLPPPGKQRERGPALLLVASV